MKQYDVFFWNYVLICYKSYELCVDLKDLPYNALNGATSIVAWKLLLLENSASDR